MKNQEIYKLSNNFHNAFDGDDKYRPAKVMYIIYKNIKKLDNVVDDLEQFRLKVINNYADVHSDDTYSIEPEKRVQANKELEDLLEMDQQIDITQLSLQDIKDLEFTPQQMEALMFMIEE